MDWSKLVKDGRGDLCDLSEPSHDVIRGIGAEGGMAFPVTDMLATSGGISCDMGRPPAKNVMERVFIWTGRKPKPVVGQ